MKKHILLFLAVFLILALIYYHPFAPSYKYSYQIEGISLLSNTIDPKTGFQEISKKESFNLITSLNEPLTEKDTYKIKALTKLLMVLSGNNKKTTLIYKIFQNNNLAYCQTNKGDVKTVEKINPKECLDLEQKNFSIILHPLSNERKIVFTENTLQLYPETLEDFDILSSFVSVKLFSNAYQILANSQAIQEAISKPT